MTQWVFTRGVSDQTRAFLDGFSEVVPLQWLQYFDERELEVSFFLVVSPKMTYKTGQMYVRLSVRQYDVNIFRTSRLPDRWVDVDETRRVYSVCPGTKIL